MEFLLPMMLPLMGLGDIGRAIMAPLYWAVSGLMKLFHWVFTPLFGYDSGWTWVCVIAALTVVVRSMMLPLYVRQLNQSRAMQTMQPKLQELQRKYGSNQERLGQETMKLYQEEGVNPMSSCLPLLIQLPIFWALFRVLREASQGHALGYFFVNDQRLVDSLSNATIFGGQLSGTFLPITDGFGPNQIVSGVLILLMTGLLFWQQLYMMRKNMPASALEGPMGNQQKMMLLLMPLMYLFAGPAIPIGVLLYWFFSNLWTVGQQIIIIRTYPTPNTPAYIAWEDRMIAKGKDPHEIERRRSGKAKAKKADSGDKKGKRDTGKVSRQSVNRSTNISKDDSGTRVKRQQVQRQSRADRKKK